MYSRRKMTIILENGTLVPREVVAGASHGAGSKRCMAEWRKELRNAMVSGAWQVKL